jgi:hypothetical protein
VVPAQVHLRHSTGERSACILGTPIDNDVDNLDDIFYLYNNSYLEAGDE